MKEGIILNKKRMNPFEKPKSKQNQSSNTTSIKSNQMRKVGDIRGQSAMQIFGIEEANKVGKIYLNQKI